jgi:hypothetical protein
MKKTYSKIDEIELRAEAFKSLRAEAKYLSNFSVKRRKKPEKQVEYYSRPWESIVVKPKNS